MKKTFQLTLALWVFSWGTAQAQGLLGQNHWTLASGMHTYTGDSQADTQLYSRIALSRAVFSQADLRFSASYLNTDGTLDNERYDYEVFTIAGDLLFYGGPDSDRLRPFIVTGLGHVEKNADHNQLNDNSDVLIHLASGLEWQINDAWVTQADLGIVRQDDNDYTQADLLLGYRLTSETLVSLQSNIRFHGQEGPDTDYATLLLAVTIFTP